MIANENKEQKRYSEKLQKLLDAPELTTDAWVQCDSCQVWRRVPSFVAQKLGEHEQWFCHKNFHQEYSTCDDEQELENDEIDVLMQMQERESRKKRAEEHGMRIQREDEEDLMRAGEAGEVDERAKATTGVGGFKMKKERREDALGDGGNGDDNDDDDDDDDDDNALLCKPIENAHVWSRVSRNIFTHREPRKLTEDDIMVCNCELNEDGSGCGEDCVNRLVLTECDPKFCPCSTACKNQRFSRKKFEDLEVKRSSKKGHGLFATEDANVIKAGEFVLEYVGEVLHEEAYEERKQQYAREKRRHFYFMTLSSSETIDATERGGVGRFLNHSCDPNCETQKWMVKGELCIGVFALREIKAGEEITIDYKFERYGEKPMRCFCETGACCGWIGGAKAAREAEKYAVDSDDEDEETIHLDDQTPIMLECNEEQIIKEEKEARSRNEGGFNKQSVKKVKSDEKKWRPPEEQKAYDRAKKAKEKKYENEEKMRLKEEKRLSSYQSLSAGRSNSRVRAPAAGSYAAKWANISSGSQRRSEIDVAMDDLRAQKGGLRNEKACLKSIGMFNLAYPVDEKGESQVSERDLGLLLEAISMTTSLQLQKVLAERGGAGALQTCISRLGGALCSPQRAPLLRKVLRVLGNWLSVCKEVTLRAMKESRTARGSFFELLGELKYSKDAELAKVAVEFAQKAPQGTIPDNGPPQSILRANSGATATVNNAGNGFMGGSMRIMMNTPMTAMGNANVNGFRTGTPPASMMMATPVVGFGSSGPPPGSATTVNRRPPVGGGGSGFNNTGPPPIGGGSGGSGGGFNQSAPTPPMMQHQQRRFDQSSSRGGGGAAAGDQHHQRDAIGRALPSGWKAKSAPSMAPSAYQYTQQQPPQQQQQYPPYHQGVNNNNNNNNNRSYNNYNANGYNMANNNYNRNSNNINNDGGGYYNNFNNNNNGFGSGGGYNNTYNNNNKRQRMDVAPPLPAGAPPPRTTDAPPAPQRNEAPIPVFKKSSTTSSFSDPFDSEFESTVSSVVEEFAMEYRAFNHPQHAKLANYDRLQKKWTLKIVTNEQKNFEQAGRKPVELTRLRASIEEYVKMANDWEFKNQHQK